jgi:alginate O-acetyltransferase complex protein AlgI
VGLLHGFLLVIERPFIARLQSVDSTIFRAVRIGFVFVCVTMLWISSSCRTSITRSGTCPACSRQAQTQTRQNCFTIWHCSIRCLVIIQHLVSRSLFERTLRGAEPYLYGSMAALMYLEAGPETSFIYFQF